MGLPSGKSDMGLPDPSSVFNLITLMKEHELTRIKSNKAIENLKCIYIHVSINVA